MGRGPTITHLFFADDSLVLFKADDASCRGVKECLSYYERALEQVINYDKSALIFSPNTRSSNQQRVKQYLNMKESRSHELYLGAPSFSLRNKRVQFGFLKEKMIKQIQAWSHRQFSKGGKEVLIKAVLQAIPTYTMSCFRVPQSLCKEMEAICARFWWGDSSLRGGIHWKSWENLCKRKEDGGLGFRQLSYFNQALMAKQVWRMMEKPESLVAQVFKARYFKNCDIVEAQLGNNPSFVWRSLCWGRELLKEGLGWIIVNGNNINACGKDWFAKWALTSRSTCKEQGKKVGDYISNDGKWKENEVRKDFLAYEANEILDRVIVREGSTDKRFWRFHPKEKYTVITGYKLGIEIKNEANKRDLPGCSKWVEEWWSKLWSLTVPPKIKIFGWQVALDILPT